MQKPHKLTFSWKFWSLCSKYFIFFNLLCFSNFLEAANFGSSGLKTGMVSSTYTGAAVATGSFTSLVSLEGEGIITQTERQNFVFTTTIALDGKDVLTRYFYVGLGQRFFLNGVSEIQNSAFQGSSMDYRPNLLWYMGWDAGVAQLLLIPFGDILASYSTIAEVGGSFGFRKNISTKLSLDGRIAASIGTGISNNAVTSQVFRAMLGIVYFF